MEQFWLRKNGGGDDSLHAKLISKYWSYFNSVPTPLKVQIITGMLAEPNTARARLNPLSEQQNYSLDSLRHHSQVRFVTFPLSCQSFLQLEQDINMDIINKYRQFLKKEFNNPDHFGTNRYIFQTRIKSLGALFPIFSPPIVIANQ